MLNRRIFPPLVIQKVTSLCNIASHSNIPTSITKLGHSISISREQFVTNIYFLWSTCRASKSSRSSCYNWCMNI
jgi:hypothetical protein